VHNVVALGNAKPEYAWEIVVAKICVALQWMAIYTTAANLRASPTGGVSATAIAKERGDATRRVSALGSLGVH